MLGGAARGAAESTRRFVLEYVREWQPADERSAARVSEALGRLSASINNHDVTLLEKPGHTAGQAHPVGTAGARLPRLLGARLAALSGSPLPKGSGQAVGRPATAFAVDATALCHPGGLCPFCNLASALLRREQLARDFSLHVGDLLHDEREGLKAMRDADDDGAGERVLTYPVIYIRGSRVAGGCAPHNNSSNPGLASNGVLQYF